MLQPREPARAAEGVGVPRPLGFSRETSTGRLSSFLWRLHSGESGSVSIGEGKYWGWCLGRLN